MSWTPPEQELLPVLCLGHQQCQNPSCVLDTSRTRIPAVFGHQQNQNPSCVWTPAEPESQLCLGHQQSQNPSCVWTPAEPESQLCLDTSRARIPAVFEHQQSQNPSCVWSWTPGQIVYPPNVSYLASHKKHIWLLRGLVDVWSKCPRCLQTSQLWTSWPVRDEVDQLIEGVPHWVTVLDIPHCCYLCRYGLHIPVQTRRGRSDEEG